MYAHPRPGVILNGETDGHFGQNFVPIEQHLVRIVPIWLFYVILDHTFWEKEMSKIFRGNATMFTGGGGGVEFKGPVDF